MVTVKNASEEEIELGDEVLSFETWNRPPSERGFWWYAITSIIGVGLLTYCILTENYLFAIITLMFGVMMLVLDLRKARRIQVTITNLGILSDDEFYPFKGMKRFAVVYEPPEVRWLYLYFKSALEPIVAIDLDDADPNSVREALLPYVLEDLTREEEYLTETVRRVYKL